MIIIHKSATIFSSICFVYKNASLLLKYVIMKTIQATYWWWHSTSQNGEEPIAIA
jgi:hypothetical protein